MTADAADRAARSVAKRALDFAAATAALALAAPFVTIAAAAIKLEDRGPITFRQRRAGKGGVPFDVVKLRTMRVNDEDPNGLGQVRTSHPLVTRTGRWLRRTKVDELPQLLNVLRGQMSLVGPRPTLPEQVERYTPAQRGRVAVRPGVTGWAQVCGNTELSWEDRILLDLWYIDHWSLALDLKILFRTVGVVLGGERIDTQALEAAREHHAKRTDRRG